VKPDKIGLVQFWWFTKNRLNKFENFKFLRIFAIKTLKNSLHLNNFGQNRIPKYIAFRPKKIEEGVADVKIEKIVSTGSF
jgi:hypothetical protein